MHSALANFCTPAHSLPFSAATDSFLAVRFTFYSYLKYCPIFRLPDLLYCFLTAFQVKFFIISGIKYVHYNICIVAGTTERFLILTPDMQEGDNPAESGLFLTEILCWLVSFFSQGQCTEAIRSFSFY